MTVGLCSGDACKAGVEITLYPDYLSFHISRCVANLRPLIDSGTMGTKGHTEVVVPHLTESYNSHVSCL